MADKKTSQLSNGGTIQDTDLIPIARGSNNYYLLGSEFGGGGGTGNVVGPDSSTNNALARYNLTTGKLIKNSVGILDDSGNLSDINNLSAIGNLTLSGSAKRLLGDFSNATRSNRLAVQTSTTNGNTRLPFLPNGTARLSGVDLHDGTDLDNSSFLQVHSDGTNNHAGLNSSKVGTGTTKDLVFQIDAVTKAKVNAADGKFNVDTLTASQLVATDASKNLQSLDVATYPSLTGISYVKGVTSAIQPQINQATPTPYETLDTSVANEAWIVDPNKNILAKLATTVYVDNAVSSQTGLQSQITAIQTELAGARGTQSSLGVKLNHGLSPYGDPLNSFVNSTGIREARMRLRKLALGESTQLVIAAIGDSYTQAPTRYCQALAKTLQTAYGFAGIGWVSFAWYGTASGTWAIGTQPSGQDGTARSDLMNAPLIIGTWTASYNQGANNTPQISKITSSTANDYVSLSIPAGHNACRLFYTGDGTGVIAVSWDDGITYGSNISLSTVGAANVLLTGIPAIASTCRIKVVSGNVALAGVDLQSSASGVRFHKLGGSGSSASQWSSVTQATWAAQMLALGSNLHLILLGTNDQAGAISAATFATQIGTMVSNLKTTLPYSDRLLVMPAENQRTTNAVAMTVYAQAIREYALANDCAFLDLQWFFGSPANFAFEYAFANTARQWYAADLIHPDPNTGGRVIADAIYRNLTTQ